MASKHIQKNKKIMPQKASRWIGHPVCVALNDGSYYVGVVQGIERGKMFLSGIKGRGKMSFKRPVRVSGLLRSLFGGGGALNSPASNAVGAFNPFAAGAVGGGLSGAGSGGGGFFGMIRNMWPTISFGLQMVRTIMPLLGGFKI